MNKMDIYEKGRKVPEEAKKIINAGKIKGFTDINPMWRIKVLTELFGACGIGWYTEIKNVWNEEGKDGKVATFCQIHLYIKVDGEWSKPIEGVGGSMFVNVWKGAPETTDECVKMAYTDAISVACKALGIGADVYFAKDRTKYDAADDMMPDPAYIENLEKKHDICIKCKKPLPETVPFKDGKTWTGREFAKAYGGKCPKCVKEENKEKNGDAK